METKTKRRGKRWPLFLGAVAVFSIVAYVLSGYVVGWVLKRALADLMESGVEVTVHNSEPRALDLSVRFPDLGVQLAHLRPKAFFRGFLPPEIGVSLDHPVEVFSVKAVQVKDARLVIDGRYAWSGRWGIQADITARETEFLGIIGRDVSCAIQATEATLDAKFKSHLKTGLLEATMKGTGVLDARLDMKGDFAIKSPYLEAKSPFEVRRTEDDEIIQIGSADASFRTYYGSGIGFRLGLSNKQGSMDFKIEKLHPRVPEVLRGFVHQAALSVDLKGRRSDRDYALFGHIKETFSSLTASVKGAVTKGPDGGALTFESRLPIDFATNNIFLMTEKPQQYPGWQGGGDIRLRIKRARSGRVDGALVTALGPIRGTWASIPFQGLNIKSDLEIVNSQIKGKGVQSVRLESLGSAFKVKRIEIDSLLPSSERLNVSRLEANLAKGRLYARPFDLQLPSFDMATEVRIDHFDLAEGAKGFQLEAISANGQAHAKVPVAFENGRFLCSGARIENVGPGVVHYKDPSVAAVKKEIFLLDDFSALLSLGQQALVFKALDNFHFEKLQLDFDRTVKKDTEITIRLKGRNPDLAKGQPFELNLPLTGQIEKLLLQSLLKSLMEKEIWEEQIEEWQHKHKAH